MSQFVARVHLLALLLLVAGLLALAPPPAQAAASLRIEAEHFDRFFDLTEANSGDAPDYPAPGPDIYRCGSRLSPCSNQHKVGAFYGGEWLEFDFSLPRRQRVQLLLRYGSRSSHPWAELLLDDHSLTGRLRLASTGHYDRLATHTLGQVELTAGAHRLRLIAHGPFSVDYLELLPVEGSAPPPTTTPAPPSPSPTPSPALSSSARQWQPWAATLTSARSYPNPYADVTLRVQFQGPDGQQFSSYGFWDGGRSFGLRALFPAPGRWSWQTTASDTSNPGLHQVRGLVEVAPASGSNPLFRRGALHISQDGRYLSHADGTPFFWLGDTAWAGPLKASEAEWETYLADRAAKGFSVVQVAPAPDWAESPETSTLPPWQGSPGGQWNPTYWQGFERKLAAANRHGLLVLVVGVMEPDGSRLAEGAARRFARQLLGRLHGLHVILSPSFDSPYDPLADRVGAELAAASQLHLLTQHPGTPGGQATNTHAERYFAQAYLDVSGNQTGHNNGDRERVARQEITWNLSLAGRTPPKPVLNLEGYYDNAGGQVEERGAYQGTAKDARAGAYRSWLSGAMGYSYGTVGIYRWTTTPGAANHWRRALDYPSSRQMTLLRELLSELAWPTLRPAHERLRDQPSRWSERAVVAITADRRVGLVYTPVSRPLALEMSGFAGPVRASWVNPITGQRSLAASRVANSGVARFSPPSGGDDWLLLLQP